MPVHRNPNAPHAVVLFLKAEVHEKLPGGHLSGDPVKREEKVFKIDCQDEGHAIKRLSDLLAELKKWNT